MSTDAPMVNGTIHSGTTVKIAGITYEPNSRPWFDEQAKF